MKDIAIFLAGATVMLAAVGAVFWWWLGCDRWSICWPPDGIALPRLSDT